MRKLLVIVGLQGAGKTTALQSVKSAEVLRPSTSRGKRAGETDEYHFEAVWDPSILAWEIDRGATKYGMRRSELDQVIDVAVTVFDPASIIVLHNAKQHLDFEVITVGLDTIDSLAAQHQRVGNDANRTISDQQKFDAERNVVLDCDIVLRGGIQQISDGLDAAIRTVAGRGGLLDGDTIAKLINAGALLSGADVSKIETASYDLRLADTYWCQGKYLSVTNTNGMVIIPPYSFVLVQAKEEACLPRFVAGTFDLTVSMFFDGLILSNGPQVDPGYRGALFCMLYNTSDNEIPLNQGIDFATIQFNTMSCVARGYAGQYQNKRTFKDFVAAKTANSPGGKILERINELKSWISSELTSFRTDVNSSAKESRDEFHKFAGLWATLLTTALFAVAGYAYSMAEKASAASEKANLVLDALAKQQERIESLLKQPQTKGGGNLPPSSGTKKTQN